MNAKIPPKFIKRIFHAPKMYMIKIKQYCKKSQKIKAHMSPKPLKLKKTRSGKFFLCFHLLCNIHKCGHFLCLDAIIFYKIIIDILYGYVV